MTPPLLVIASLVVLAALLFGLENARPLRGRTRELWGRLLVNLVVSALTFACAAVLIRPLVMQLAAWTGEGALGLVHVGGLAPPLQAVLAFLLMDLSFYYWHLANHRVPFLWRFHNVHHVDPDLDVTTALRFHFGEVALSAAFRVVQITLIGPSLAVYAVYEVAFQANTLFHHSNLRLPIGLERALNLVLVTPRMHGIHHSQVREENQSNYSVVLCWWDRLHRSLRLNVPQASVAVGVPGYASAEDNRLPGLLAMPFRRQHDYWAGPDGLPVERDASTLGPSRGRLEA